MNINLNRILCMVCVLISIAACNSGPADDEKKDVTGRSNSESREEDFVRDALEDNMEQKAWIKEAMTNATDVEIKSAAKEMMQENERVWASLNNYAKTRSFPTDDIDTNSEVNLIEQKGMEWDEEWADEIGDKQRQAIKRFERAQNRVEDAELKDIITQNLSTLRSRLDKVERLEARLDDNIGLIMK
jgi:predicted outer membrane protein